MSNTEDDRRRAYVEELRADFGAMGKTVYDRADRWQDEHDENPGCRAYIHRRASETYDGVWIMGCSMHDAVFVVDEVFFTVAGQKIKR